MTHKAETELAWIIGIIMISTLSASWVSEKVREQHEDRLISMLVLVSIWQQTIGKGFGPGHSSMAQDSSHSQNTTTHWGSAHHGGSLNYHTDCLAEWLAEQRWTDNKGQWTEGKKLGEVVRMKREHRRKKVKIMKLSLNPCLIQDTIRFVLAWMETMRKAFIIYEEDFDLSIETLPLCISLAKAQFDEKMWTVRG